VMVEGRQKPERPVRGEVVADNVVVFDLEDARRIYSAAFYGKPLGVPKPKDYEFEAPLLLDLVEACYLVEEGVLEVYEGGVKLSFSELFTRGARSNSRLEQLYRVYMDLRKRGFVVTSGIKFGSDFAVYKYGPGIDHAPFIVQVMQENETISAAELVRAGRLATTVRKNFIVAIPQRGGRVRYLVFSWLRI
jgi:tRNA-intron endonuclease